MPQNISPVPPETNERTEFPATVLNYLLGLRMIKMLADEMSRGDWGMTGRQGGWGMTERLG